MAKVTYYSALIENNKNNPRFPFNRMTQSQSSAEPQILLSLTSNDFLNLINTKSLLIRETIQKQLSSTGTYLFLKVIRDLEVRHQIVT